MAHSNFTPDDPKWTVRYGHPGDDQESWHGFYGDEFNWTSLVPLLWQTLDYPAARILPPKAREHGFSMEACAWWNGALHLLAFGMGWVDMSKGLREWRESGFSRDNAVLRLVYDTYGPSIEALEYWLTGKDFTYLLAPISIGQPFREVSRPSSDYIDEQTLRLTFAVESGPRHRLTKELLNFNDHLHLTGHFPGSVLGNHSFEKPDAVYVDRDENRHVIQPRLYQGWYPLLVQYFNDHGELLNQGGLVTVNLSQIGTLGTYSVAPGTGRPFRRTPRKDFDNDVRFHWMGN